MPCRGGTDIGPTKVKVVPPVFPVVAACSAEAARSCGRGSLSLIMPALAMVLAVRVAAYSGVIEFVYRHRIVARMS